MNPPRAKALMLAVITVTCWSASFQAQASVSRPTPGPATDPHRPVAASNAPLPWRGFPGESASPQPA